MSDVLNIRIPESEIAALDSAIASHFKSRSEAIREAVRRLVRDLTEEALVESHRAAYAEPNGNDDSAVLRQSRKARNRRLLEDE